MESKYLIEIRRIINSLSTSDVSNKDIYKLQKLEVNLCKRIEKTILNNPGIGKSFLTTTLRELLKEHQYVELKIKSKLKELQQNGYESNDEVYANTIEVINNFEDLIQSLAKTDKNYFINQTPSTITELKKEKNYFINQIISITEVKQNIETEPTIVNEKIKDIQKIKDEIDALISTMDPKKWEKVFHNENDYSEYKEILAKFFTDQNFIITDKIINIKRKSKTSIIGIFKPLHDKNSTFAGHMTQDKKYFNLVRILSEWQLSNDAQIYKRIMSDSL